MAKRVTSIRLSEETVAEIDRKRGSATRTAFVTAAIHNYQSRRKTRAPQRATRAWALWNLEQVAEFDPQRCDQAR
jgi:hypothetical protein